MIPAYRRPCRPSAPRCATSPWLCRNLPTRSILLLPPAAVAAAIAPWGCAEAREQRKLSPSADASSSSAGERHPASPRRADSGSDAVSCWSLRRTCWWPHAGRMAMDPRSSASWGGRTRVSRRSRRATVSDLAGDVACPEGGGLVDGCRGGRKRSRHRKRRGATLDNPQSHLQPPSDTRSTWPL